MKIGTTEVTRLSAGGTLAREARQGQQLVWSIFKDPVSALFFRRQTAGGSVTSPALPQYGKALLSTIKGNSMVWNQLYNGAIVSSIGGVTCAYSDGIITLNGGYTLSYGGIIMSWSALGLASNHSYVFLINKVSGSITKVGAVVELNTGTSGRINIEGGRTMFSSLQGVDFRLNATQGDVFDNYKFQLSIIDLTLLFNNSIPTGYTVADFERDYPLKYYGYNPGQIIDLKGAFLETVGFNQCPTPPAILWNNLPGSLNTNTATFLRAGQSYHLHHKALSVANWRHLYKFFDLEGNVISSNVFSVVPAGAPYYNSLGFWLDAADYPLTDVDFTPAVDCYAYFGFGNGAVTSSTVVEDFIVNLSNASKNGTYEPYWKETKNLGLDKIKVQSPNVWDEEWTNKRFDDNTHVWVDDPNVASKNLIPILPNTAYYFKNPAGTASRWVFYDADGNYLSYQSASSNSTFTTPSGAYFMMFGMGGGYTGSYHYDITINLSDPSLNGKYFPRRVPGLAKAGSVYDEKNAVTQKYVKRRKRVNMGDLSWTRYESNSFLCNDLNSVAKFPSAFTQSINAICSKYGGAVPYDGSSTKDKILFSTWEGAGAGLSIRVKDTAYDNATTFKAAMDGVYLDFEIATPEEYDLETPMDAEYKMDYLGTEALTPENSSTPSTAKFSAEIKYPK